MHEELASMNSPCGKTICKNIFKGKERTLTQYNLKWNLLRCVTTLGGKNMCGTNKAFLDEIKAYGNLLQ